MVTKAWFNGKEIFADEALEHHAVENTIFCPYKESVKERTEAITKRIVKRMKRTFSRILKVTED